MKKQKRSASIGEFLTKLPKRLICALLIVLQIAFIVVLVIDTSYYSGILKALLQILSIIAVVHVINSKLKPEYKTIWVMLILIVPIVGGVLYILYCAQPSVRMFRKTGKLIQSASRDLFVLPTPRTGNSDESALLADQIHYLEKTAGFPAYSCCNATYFSPGQAMLEPYLNKLKSAKKYIFMEYFIISGGKVWDRILSVLSEKAAEGVDVRIIYDDVGSMMTLPNNFEKSLSARGIKCYAFNPFNPFFSTVQNNRDHRKITVIDGICAFTGGINLSDEYFNIRKKHGYWMDSAIMIEGKAAWSFTVMFLQTWEMLDNRKRLRYRKKSQIFDGFAENTATFLPDNFPCNCSDPSSLGLIQPYADSPTDSEYIGENAYLGVIRSAKRYLYITTPYLILDEAMLSAIKMAAKSGVDVRIVMPHHPDKKFVHITSRSYYAELIEAGVKIYEFTHGFIHSKIFICDDEVATVGTINLDYRSLYLHFECGVKIYANPVIQDMLISFNKTLEHCSLITPEECKTNIFVRIFKQICRIFAPLM